MNSDAILTRTVRGGKVDVHPAEKALIVRYEAEATICSETGHPVIGDKKECQKIIRLNNLDEKSDVHELGVKIIENCKLISPAQLPEIEYYLKYLAKRKPPKSRKAVAPASNEKLADPGAFESAEIDETAHMTEVDDYLDLLYEDMSDKLRASALILQLARNPDNLEELFRNEILVGALARVLREDWKKSLDLTTNLVYIFFCFSSFSNFHSVILHFKIGALVVTIFEHELQKHNLWTEDLSKKRADMGDSSLEFKAAQNRLNTLMKKQEQLFRVAIYLLLNLAEKVEVESKMQRKGIVHLLCRCLNRTNNDELLILVVSFLKKLSIFQENVADMIGHNIIQQLTGFLSLPQPTLVRITLRLLYNLTFNADLRDAMMTHLLPVLLVPFLSVESHQSIALRIIYQLSVENRYKSHIAKSGCLPVLMRAVLCNPEPASDLECAAVLINLSRDWTAAQMIGEPRGVRMIMKRALRYRDGLLMKLIRNISEFEQLRLQFVEFLSDIVAAVLTLKSPDYRHDGRHSSLGLRLPNDSGDDASGNDSSILGDTKDTGDDIDESEEKESVTFALECLRLLVNLRMEELDFARVLDELQLLSWLEGSLAQQERKLADDDILLETIRLVGTVSVDAAAAQMIAAAENNILPNLIGFLNSRQEDDEMVCQILGVFHQLLLHEESRDYLINRTQAPVYILDLMHDKNVEIRRVCNQSLDIIADNDETWASRLQMERFRWHNSQWLSLVDSAAATLAPSENDALQRPHPSHHPASSLYCEGDYEDEDSGNEHYFMASNLLEDAASWFNTAPPKQGFGDTCDLMDQLKLDIPPEATGMYFDGFEDLQDI